MTALIVGTLLALVALVYVLWPIITAAERRPAITSPPPQVREAHPDSALELETPPAPEASVEDAVEAEIRRARAQLKVCPVCGPRPEAAARYCSRCGRALA